MRYVLAILIMGLGFWYWIQPRDYSTFQGTYGNTMSNAEKAYYVQMFNHTMSHVHDGNAYPWESYNSKGAITPTETFVSQSKAICRHYTEDFTIGQYSGQQAGTSCKRQGKAGWCRIALGSPQSCAMENKNLALSFGQLNVGAVDLSGIDIGGVEISIPMADTGGIGHVQKPDVPESDWEFPIKEREDGQTTADWLIQ